MSDIRLAIIGCGNPNRRDDGVGPWVIARLRAHTLPAYVDLYDAGTDGMGLLYRAKGMSHLIIVDARAPEGAAGALFEVPGAVLAAPPPQSFTLHDFRWDHALYAGKKIYGQDFPQCVKVFLIEAADLSLGLGLSAAVQATATTLVAQLIDIAFHPGDSFMDLGQGA